ncbi:hypothetical protein C1940_17100 (plasmid) [Lactiplantibacillus plantarum subsp. plantarum]|uniref:thermonuclease family protein n=1 Tax=Lactiplantibacillus plantarum TaxID=1590 RepID=UPI000CD37B06|nr:thermonuclease family protein [Lactiplantibacillus plantarum]AUV74169.1 hypothetical protein C1940_17100 [Lactiplantibacillus plantarum subsp. plantarum]
MQKIVWPTFWKLLIVTLVCSILVLLLMLRTNGISKTTNSQSSSIARGENTHSSSFVRHKTSDSNKTTTKPNNTYKVTGVTSGDKLRITNGNYSHSIKLLLVQAPTTKFKAESKWALDKLVMGQQVTLQYDANADEHLPYVYLNHELIQTKLLEQGDVILKGANTTEKHYQEMRSAQDAAEKDTRGVWSYAGFVNENGYSDN